MLRLVSLIGILVALAGFVITFVGMLMLMTGTLQTPDGNMPVLLAVGLGCAFLGALTFIGARTLQYYR